MEVIFLFLLIPKIFKECRYFFNPSIIPRQTRPMNCPITVVKVKRKAFVKKNMASSNRLFKKSLNSIKVIVSKETFVNEDI
jgi:hypothetical protein